MGSQGDFNRLSKDELEYELSMKGLEDLRTVEMMLSSLRNVQKVERSGQSLTYSPHA